VRASYHVGAGTLTTRVCMTQRLTSGSQRDEPLPTLNAAIHLLATIYTAVFDMPEFHRRVVVPTLQKFSVALVQLAEKPQSPVKLKVRYDTSIPFQMLTSPSRLYVYTH
jgi:hypothetical protein